MKRITFITGHYGSGKSECAINLAITKKVDLVIDLDIVNPYFRSREVEDLLKENNIKMISSSVKNALGSDLPFISSEVYEPFRDRTRTAILDLGGDNVGAKLIRQFSDEIDLAEVDLLFTINVYRESTSTTPKILKMIEEIESGGGLKVTGFINNSNLLRDTTYEDIKNGEKIIEEVEKITNLKTIYTGVNINLIKDCGTLSGEILPLKLYLRKKWL